jgi:sigma-E factor negative regulatory protein RseA
MNNDDTLSALMDDEAEDLALRRMLRDLPQQPETLVRWRRYQLVREVLGGGRPRSDVDLAARVRASLEAGDAGMAETTGGIFAGQGPQAARTVQGAGGSGERVSGFTGRGGTWRRAAGSFAVAASVAAVVLVGGQQLLRVDSDAGGIGALPTGVVNTRGAVPMQASFGAGNAASPGNATVNSYSEQNPAGAAAPALQPADRTAYRELARQRLRRYSLEHAEHAALNTPAGLMPYARVPRAAVAEQ